MTRRTFVLTFGAFAALSSLAYVNRYTLEHTLLHHAGMRHMGGFGMAHMFKDVDTTEAEEAELRGFCPVPRANIMASLLR